MSESRTYSWQKFTYPADANASTYAAPNPLLPENLLIMNIFESSRISRTTSNNNTFILQVLQLRGDSTINGSGISIVRGHVKYIIRRLLVLIFRSE